ncbi:GNAT family N-acetyltransferase [bacterium]|nr:GNAT family N-acetyltransferase [bacterium]MBU1994614.1 GNAT family N-acetyltransferase [bacterium]
MFRIRKILDNTSLANQSTINQVREIIKKQFPCARKEELVKISLQLNDPMKYRYRSILFVVENNLGKVKGFAMLLHMPDIKIAYLELISAAPGKTGGGIGSALYEYIREECLLLKVKGLFFECSIDDASVIKDETILKQNSARLKFYERYGVYPILNNVYASPVNPGDKDLYYLLMDKLGQNYPIEQKLGHKIVGAILERKYGDLIPKSQIAEVVRSFKDEEFVCRAPKYIKKPSIVKVALKDREKITLVVNEGHDIHHVQELGYVEAPVRLPIILESLEKTGLFLRVQPKKASDKLLKQVHMGAYVDYLRRACEVIEPGTSIYPIVFPIRNLARPPKDIELQIGYYALDTFTPLNENAYKAARGAVDCAVTAADSVLSGAHIAYALVRPPGHHAERRTLGGFCYFNSAAVAAHHLSGFGKVAVLDVDFHHGNGTQDIFYERSDVLTISIHGDPKFAYPHFAGFKDERGEKEGEGFNINYPLPEHTTPEQYRRTLISALKQIIKFNPLYLVISLGLDTAKADPTGTWSNEAEDFKAIGRLIGELKIPTLVVQEGGYRTQTLGKNARYFFEGLWGGFAEE